MELKPKPRRLRRLRGVALHLGVVLIVGWGAWTLTMRAARATVYEKMLGLGNEMARFLDDDSTTDKPRKVVINGQTLNVSTGRTVQSVQDVIGFYKGRYGNNNAGMSEFVSGFARKLLASKHKKFAKHRKDLETMASVGAPTAITHVKGDGGGEEGFGAFMDLGSSREIDRSIGDHLKRFEESGNLSELGKFYYVHAKKRGGRTTFMLLSADEKFNVWDALGQPRKGKPAQGDLAGADLPGVPRYPGATRSLSASEPARNYGLASYAVPADPGTVEAFYRARMVQAGWELDAAFDKGSALSRRDKPELARALRFQRGHSNVALTFAEAKEAGGTTMMVVGHAKPELASPEARKPPQI
jgi:hypothetical protein